MNNPKDMDFQKPPEKLTGFFFLPILFSVESLPLSEIAGHLDKDTLKTLKKEYGGLQTLLRNNYQVFKGKNVVPSLSLSGLSFGSFWCEP